MEHVRQIARAAQVWGQQTTVASLDTPGQAFLEGNPFVSVALGPVLLNFGYTPRLVPWLRLHAREFDAVIVNGIWQYNSLAVWRALRGGPVPYFVFPHGMLDPYFKNAFPLKHWKKLLYWPWQYRVLRDARAVLFTCDEERLLARESFRPYQCREEVGGYGTAPPAFDRSTATEEFFTAFPALRDRRIALFLGRIHEKKGCDLLIEAFAATAARDDLRWQLVLAGPCEEPLASKLRASADALGIAQRITWTGMLAAERKWGALYAAEVFALPSHQENFGIAVAEALACGTPVLISNKVNIWREIAADSAGMVEADTAAGARSLLQRWMALDPAGREQMRLRARACFDARFDIRSVASVIMAKIEQLTMERG